MMGRRGSFLYRLCGPAPPQVLISLILFSFTFSNQIFSIGCKEGHKLVKKITKKDTKANAAFEKGEYKLAIDTWWEAMNTDMSLLTFVRPTLLKIVKAHTALKEHDKAIEEAKKHVDNEESVEGLHALGEAYMAGEKFDEAVRYYQRAMEIAVSSFYVVTGYSSYAK